MIKNIFLSIFIFYSMLSSNEILDKKVAIHCLILEDENSIICKLEFPRSSIDRKIKVQWINPSEEVSRQRDMIIPATHGSIYDYRYISGRENGIWTFKVTIDDKSYSTTFELK